MSIERDISIEFQELTSELFSLVDVRQEGSWEVNQTRKPKKGGSLHRDLTDQSDLCKTYQHFFDG